MGIPKPPLSGHLSPISPHRKPLIVLTTFTLSFPLCTFFTFLLLSLHTDPFAFLDAFLLLFTHLCSLYWQHPNPTPFLYNNKLTHSHIHHPNTHTGPLCSSPFSTFPKTTPSLRLTVLFMENSSSASFFSTITTSTETYPMTTHLRPTSMGGPHNSHFSMYEPLSLPSTASPAASQYYYPARYQLPPHENLQLAYTYPYLQAGQSSAYPAQPFMAGQNTALYGMPNPQSHVLSMEQERRRLDAWMTKVARSKRKMARQRSLSLTKNSAGSSSSTHADPRALIVSGADTLLQNSNNNAHHANLYSFCTPDKKRLRVLLKKELKNSDVGSLGRIVLPKREAEENLPILSDKEGIQVMIRDVYSYQEWGLKYKYWSNNKSRMYVLENTGDFVKQNGLEMGDSITLYEDECKNLYVSIKRKERPMAEPSYEQPYSTTKTYYNNDANMYDINNPTKDMSTYDMYNTSYEARDEEEASLALLIEQLKHDTNSLVTLSLEPHQPSVNNVVGSSTTSLASRRQATTAAELSSSSSSSSRSKNQDFYDCYTGLGTLPEDYNYISDHINE